ncbi:MAG: hypothetical protein GF390_03560 [Candidatus Pacebacteria bacterium]|nr:hypothetical protein [Candidatus Paceibacterota bacterium]
MCPPTTEQGINALQQKIRRNEADLIDSALISPLEDVVDHLQNNHPPQITAAEITAITSRGGDSLQQILNCLIEHRVLSSSGGGMYQVNYGPTTEPAWGTSAGQEPSNPVMVIRKDDGQGERKARQKQSKESKTSPLGLTSTVATEQGPRSYQEDAYLPLQELMKGYGVFLAGVFDGHGGAQVANFVSRNLPTVLTQIIRQQFDKGKSYIELMREAFAKMEQLVIAEVPCEQTGSTAGAVLIVNRPDQAPTLVHANLADAEIVVCHDGKARVLSQYQKLKQPITMHIGHGKQVKTAQININEAFGNFDYKQQKLVSAVPYVGEYRLSPRDEFAIIASDGLWNFVTHQEAVALVKHTPPDQAAEALKNFALQRMWDKAQKLFKETRSKPEHRFYPLQSAVEVYREIGDNVTAQVINLNHSNN